MDTPELSLTSQELENGDIVVLIVLSGPLDGHTYDKLGSKIDRLLHHGTAKIIIDLGGVDYISSAGVGVFVAARSKARTEKGCIVLLNLSEQVKKVFDVLQIRELLNIATDLQEAEADACQQLIQRGRTPECRRCAAMSRLWAVGLASVAAAIAPDGPWFTR